MAKVIENILGGISFLNFDHKKEYPISITRGVRQGDVPSPFLFALAMNFLLVDIHNNNELNHFVFNIKVNMWSYADDSAFCFNNESQYDVIIKKLGWFEDVTSVGNNIPKFQGLARGTEAKILFKDIQNKRGTNYETNDVTYLGYNYIDGNPNWMKLVSRIKKKANILKNFIQSLRFTDAAEVINTHLASMTTYFLRFQNPDKDSDLFKFWDSLCSELVKGRIGTDRLYVPVEFAGFGILNLYEFANSLKMGYLPHILLMDKSDPIKTMIWNSARIDDESADYLVSWDPIEDDSHPFFELFNTWCHIMFKNKMMVGQTFSTYDDKNDLGTNIYTVKEVIDHNQLNSIYVKTEENNDLFPTTDIYPTHWSENKPWKSIDAITTQRKSGKQPRHLLKFTPLCDASSKFFRLKNCEIRLTKSQSKRYNPTGKLSEADTRELLIKDFHAADGYPNRIRNHWRDLVSNLSKVCYHSVSEDK